MADNGNSMWWKVVTAILIPCLLLIGTNVIANDRASRDRDDKTEERITTICEKQYDVNSEILVALKEIQTEQRVTKELIKNGRVNGT